MICIRPRFHLKRKKRRCGYLIHTQKPLPGLLQCLHSFVTGDNPLQTNERKENRSPNHNRTSNRINTTATLSIFQHAPSTQDTHPPGPTNITFSTNRSLQQSHLLVVAVTTMAPVDSVPSPSRGDQHIRHVPLSSLSKLSPFSMLILSIVLVILFLLKQFIFEAFLMKRCYKAMYTRLDEVSRRGFINHHIAGGTKLLILVVAVYPFIDVAFGQATLNTPYSRGSRVTLGDILIVCSQILVGMYIFELIYRVKISPISTMHHIGAIMVTQSAIAISLNLAREPDATIEFILCTVWGESFSSLICSLIRRHTDFDTGAFDIVCELIPHVAIILYRVYPNSHLFLSRLFLFACVSTFIGTLCETIVIFYLFGSLWSQWQLAFKIVTPLLHCAFSATQLHGSRIFFFMWKKQNKYLAEEYQKKVEGQGRAEDGDVTGVDVRPAKEETNAEREAEAGGIV